MVRKLEFTIAASIDVPLYLFDEPTAALDLATIPAVHELFREKQAAGKTIVVASHRPMTADIADRIAFLADGRIVATGTPAELLASVPPVLETGASNASALTAVVDGEPFAVAGSIHGFVPSQYEDAVADTPGRILDELAATSGIDRTALAIAEPTYTDLFTYYTNGPSTPTSADHR
jgi:ABC-2 type transport system ATP-binding protein